MKVRKLEVREVKQVLQLLIYCIDQVKDLETVTLSKFREISDDGGSIMDHLIKTLNNETNNFLKDKIENYEEYMIGFNNLCIQSDEKISLKDYLDAIIKIDLYNHLEKQFCTSNNGLAYSMVSIMEHLSPLYCDPLEI